MKKLLIFLVIIAVGLGGIAYWVSRPGEARHVDYTTTPIDFGNLTESINATGILQPHEIAVVTGDMPGKVTDILVKINDKVKKGQPLLKLDNREATIRLKLAKLSQQLAEQELHKATAQRNAAKAASDKLQGLRSDIRPEADAIKAKAELEAAQAQVQQAELKIEEAKQGVEGAQLRMDVTTINAPISGTIIDKHVYLGQPVGVAAPSASSGAEKSATSSTPKPLFIIARDLGQMDVHGQVLEGDIGKVRVGQKGTFRPYAYSNRAEPFPATVAEIHQMPVNLQGAVLYDVVLTAKNEMDPKTREWMLRPGMTATVDMVRREHRHVWKVPAAALDFQLDEHYETAQAKAKLEEWKKRSDRDDWQYVWTVDKNGEPWPIFVKTNAVDKEGDPIGISDGQFKEVVQWDPELKGKLNPKDRDSYPKAIIAAPPWQKPGLFDQPTKFKFS